MREDENTTPTAPQIFCTGEARPFDSVPEEMQIPALAREAVETLVLRRYVVRPTISYATPLLSRPSACFVCIKTLGRELRGCIGTVEPEKSTLAEEIIANAIKAATRDPRFRPVVENELPSLRYSVDVLEPPEPARLKDLDPTVFGVVVVDSSGSRRGLLLPNIENVKTPDHQVNIAARKAGIAPDAPLTLYRFRTRRFGERD